MVIRLVKYLGPLSYFVNQTAFKFSLGYIQIGNVAPRSSNCASSILSTLVPHCSVLNRR